MRLVTPLSLSLAAAAALVPVSPAAATGACVGDNARAFPLATRIRGGPDSYEPGGGYGTWYIDLTNTTHRTCTDVHPVIVLVDDKRALRPDQPQLDFYDGPRARPVTFESTDEQELIGVLDAPGFHGFAVPPGRTVSVRVRLALPSDTPLDQVTANAAVVQRRGDDGDWVGESNAYRFGIGEEKRDQTPEPSGTPVSPGPRPSGSASAGPGTGTPTASPDAAPFAAGPEDADERARELARTGPGRADLLLAATVALLAIGATAFRLSARRHR